MKKTVLTLIIICLALSGFAQIDSTKQYFKSPYIPEFSIRKVPDSSIFTNKMLQKNKPVILMFFDPDCDHCQHATKNFTKEIKKFEDVQILMVTIYEMSKINKFRKDYKLAQYSNITVTKDVTFDLAKYYQVSSLPDVYVYDKNGKLMNHYKHDIPVDEIAGLF